MIPVPGQRRTDGEPTAIGVSSRSGHVDVVGPIRVPVLPRYSTSPSPRVMLTGTKSVTLLLGQSPGDHRRCPGQAETVNRNVICREGGAGKRSTGTRAAAREPVIFRLMVASVAAVTFERRASDGQPGVLTLTASLPNVIPAANLIVAVTLLSFATVKLATRIAARSLGPVAPVRPTPVITWCAFIGSPWTHGGSSTRCHTRDSVQFWCGLLSIRFRLLLLASGQVESFNRRLGDESLNAHRFMTLMEARHHNDRWPGQYNQEPQSSLVYLKVNRKWPTLARTKAH